MAINTRIGILGGGQLGKMLVQAGSRWNLDMWVMDKDFDFPAAGVTNQFIKGDFADYEQVYQLGKLVDVVTIEIENVNIQALYHLESEGKDIYPSPKLIETIKDKGLQKLFYRNNRLPTSTFNLFENADQIRSAVSSGELSIPFAQKARTEGYDGRGVFLVRSEVDLENLLDVRSVVEDMVDIDKELAVLVARNPSGALAIFPPVEMTFHPEANLVEELLSPARIDESLRKEIELLAEKLAVAFDLVGLLAIELFLTSSGSILINEAAPRPHNSGHHTIEGNITSQYEQLLRAILDLPLGATDITSPAAMINLLGAEGHHGPAHYAGLDRCLAMERVYLHIYGKADTKPFRKMGHATILDQDLEIAIKKAKEVRRTLEVIT